MWPAETSDFGESLPEEKPVLPDREICHTSRIGQLVSFAMCEVKSPESCPHVIALARGYVCSNPNWRLFLKEDAS